MPATASRRSPWPRATRFPTATSRSPHPPRRQRLSRPASLAPRRPRRILHAHGPAAGADGLAPHARPLEMIFLLDCSGSMDGPPLEEDQGGDHLGPGKSRRARQLPDRHLRQSAGGPLRQPHPRQRRQRACRPRPRSAASATAAAPRCSPASGPRWTTPATARRRIIAYR